MDLRLGSRARFISTILAAVLSTMIVPVQAEPLPILPFGGSGNLFVLEAATDSILEITPDGAVSVSVTKQEIVAASGGSDIQFFTSGLAFGADGTGYFTAHVVTPGSWLQGTALFGLSPAGDVSVLATAIEIADASGASGIGRRSDAEGLAIGPDGTIYLIEDTADAVLAVDPATGDVTVFVDHGDLVTATGSAWANLGAKIVIDPAGNLYVTVSDDPFFDRGPTSILKIAPEGTVAVLPAAPNEIQVIEVTATAGTYTLAFGGQTTAPIDAGATVAEVESALAALANIGVGNVEVTGAGSRQDPFYVEFLAAKAGNDQEQIEMVSASLEGGTVVIRTQLDGGSFDHIGRSLTRAPDGALVVSDDDDDWILRVSPDGVSVSTLITEADIRVLNGEVEPNLGWGSAYDDFGALFIVDDGSGTILRFDAAGNGVVFLTAAAAQAALGVEPAWVGAIAFAPGPRPVLAVAPDRGHPGSGFTVTGTDCPEDTATVDVSFPTAVTKSSPVEPDGGFSVEFTVPVGTPAGSYAISANCGDRASVVKPYQSTAFVVDDSVFIPLAAEPGSGYRLVAADGGVFAFGDRAFHGSTGDVVLNRPIVGGATDVSDYDGYWMVGSDGGVFTFDAPFLGSLGGRTLKAPAVEIEPTPTGDGYWIVLADGTVHNFGDAEHLGDFSGRDLNQPIISMSVTRSGNGYWLVAADGGIFNFGDAGFFGSTGGMALTAPIIDLAPAIDDKGYYLLGFDGGVFAFGSADFKGSTGDLILNKPVVAMLTAPNGAGYWLAASDGGVFTFGSIPFLGSMGATKLNSPVLDLVD